MIKENLNGIFKLKSHSHVIALAKENSNYFSLFGFICQRQIIYHMTEQTEV